ncbi:MULTISPECIES: 4Fe-4S binding protein [Psychrilyobacter]|uniref:4Fe-4S binding protein n=1 Tax=Psychrilyobacter piezotolerans TaxID=2293438 RepID=A0ABX9KIR5_9FUSO|nr:MULTISPECIES: 4Fe-4S binding protein [Psychrilyobacter]MCS5420597.1 4Fe-4S binding protein [Psychrilyobacter sp. S5]NDI77383.1 4Fe-4S binding protein [Psychrilyobacter piezotolerans]RDE63779.1 4Fe-4S binding protein [Psychrilyobacter sp. S5]REI42123.1 4Fe-4S binding protein [Psychrilyobacter piezotolerans]
MRKSLLKLKVQTHWSWILLVAYFGLSIMDIRLGILGFLCMLAPIFQGFRGRGRIHCSHYCPRGAFFGRFIPELGKKRYLPVKLRSNKSKYIILGVMMTSFAFSMLSSGGTLEGIGRGMLRMMGSSLLAGIGLGMFYIPRAWCQICPMKTATKEVEKRRS